MPRRLAQQRMILSDLECLKLTSSASRAISAVAQLLAIDIRYDALTFAQSRRVYPAFTTPTTKIN